MATLTLAANITAAQRSFRVEGEITADHVPGYRFRIGSEAFELDGFVQEVFGSKPGRRLNPRYWEVTRHILGTTAATHTAADAIYAIVPELATASSASLTDGLAAEEQAALADHGAATAEAPAALTSAQLTGGESPTEAEFNALQADVDALRTVVAALVVDDGTLIAKINAALSRLRLANVIAD